MDGQSAEYRGREAWEGKGGKRVLSFLSNPLPGKKVTDAVPLHHLKESQCTGSTDPLSLEIYFLKGTAKEECAVCVSLSLAHTERVSECAPLTSLPLIHFTPPHL